MLTWFVTPTGLLVGQAVMLTQITHAELTATYDSVASTSFVSYLSDPHLHAVFCRHGGQGPCRKVRVSMLMLLVMTMMMVMVMVKGDGDSNACAEGGE